MLIFMLLSSGYNTSLCNNIFDPDWLEFSGTNLENQPYDWLIDWSVCLSDSAPLFSSFSQRHFFITSI